MKNKNDYKLIKVKLKEFKIAYGIILECSEWLKSKGINQWNPPYPENLFKKDVLGGNVYLFYYPKKLKLQNRNEIYICRLAVPRKFKGNGIGKKLLDEAENLCMSKNIRKIKLDIARHHKFLKDYYINAGFTPVEEFVPAKIGKKIFHPGILMEKVLNKS